MKLLLNYEKFLDSVESSLFLGGSMFMDFVVHPVHTNIRSHKRITLDIVTQQTSYLYVTS